MSERNVELTRRYIEAFNARDIEAFIAYCDPSIELHSVFSGLGGTVHHGHEGVRKWHRDLDDAWGEEIRIQPQAYFDLAECTLAFYVWHARGRQSGAETAMPNASVTRWRDGLIVDLKGYVRREDALTDLGVSNENELEPIAP